MTDNIVTLEITDLAYTGKSVAHRDGKVVFIKGGLPGETVEVEITRSKPRFDEGRVIRIVEKSDKRIDTPCTHFSICGGCTWQDLDYSSQLEFKKKQVTDCLQRIGTLEEVSIGNVLGSVELFNYRNKMEFSFHKSNEEDFTLGLHERGHFDRIFNIEKCFLQSNTASEIVKWMRQYVADEKIPVYDVKNHTGFMRFLMIRQAKRTSQLMVNVVTNYGEFPDREKLVKGLTGQFPQVSTIVHNQNGQKSNIATGEIEKIFLGSGYIEEKLFDSIFRIHANTFFQTNTIQTEALYHTALEMLDPRSGDRVMDLYCGTGSIGILLSSYVSEIVGVELVTQSVEAARANAQVNHVENITFFEGDVKDFLRTTGDTQFDTIIVDPPRAGMNPKALKRMLEIKPEKILYISCNPASFARDSKSIVANGYRLPKVQPVDMFPHTMHIELVAVFNQN